VGVKRNPSTTREFEDFSGDQLVVLNAGIDAEAVRYATSADC
jgi:hypothetical protein